MSKKTRAVSKPAATPAAQGTNITTMSTENRRFKPSKDFSKRAHIKSLAQYKKIYNASIKAPEKFWAQVAQQELVWFRPFKTTLQWKEPFAKWFIGGQINVRHKRPGKKLNTPITKKKDLNCG